MVWFQRQAGKFNNRKTVYAGRKYDSMGEAGLAMEIDALVKKGDIIKVEPQVTFNLYGKNGGKICTHRPDFLITKKDGTQEVWEYKGFPTDVWRMKLKLWEDNYPYIPYWVITARDRYYTSQKRKRL